MENINIFVGGIDAVESNRFACDRPYCDWRPAESARDLNHCSTQEEILVERSRVEVTPVSGILCKKQIHLH